MEELLQKIKDLVPEIKQWATELEPEYWAAGGGGLVILVGISALLRRAKKRKLRRLAPQIALEAFKISPLGRDAFFKIQNLGEKATLTMINILGRKDIVVKNAVAGHVLEKGKMYSILLEVNGPQKLDANFSIQLRYMDERNNVYRQTFVLNQNLAKAPKLVRR